MDIVVIAIVGFTVLVLLVKIATLNARMEGFRDAQQQMGNYGNNYAGGSLWGLVKILAIIGFLAVCILCLYAGMALATLGN